MRGISKFKCLKNVVHIICLSSIYLFIYLCMYEVLVFYNKSKIFFFIPILVFILVTIINNILRFSISNKMNIITTIITFLILCVLVNIRFFNQLYMKNNSMILTFLTLISFINLLISKYYVDKNYNLQLLTKSPIQDLFNLFYVNTSKVHEIAMLIDNKIMKMVEKEQFSEELLKTTSSLASSTAMLSGETSIQKENNYKKRVYENFDVKTTKSILLRKLYEVAKQSSNRETSIVSGQLILFRDVELKRINIDDTVMILNVLKDSKLRNQGDENIEIDMNKMMQKILDDFTIDYQFEQKISDDCKNMKCLIQIPYSANDNFENGYQHNDLQLGKLSIVGIYRGEIDFSKKESVSSKFLEIMSDSYKKDFSSKWNDDIMKDSYINEEAEISPFNFEPNKLNEKMHLIDVIAIIQELRINGETKNE